MAASQLLIGLARYLLVILFFPFSALDKTLNFRGAVEQARQVVPEERSAEALILAGLVVEISMPLAILTGRCDRPAAAIMAGYCATTALLWKQFWKEDDFWAEGQSKGRDLFWDFLKNFSLAGGFLLLAVGTSAASAEAVLADKQLSSHPYRLRRKARRR